MDVNEELGAEDVSYFQSLIGILKWMVELGRVDITYEVSMLSSHLTLPLLFDPSDIDIRLEDLLNKIGQHLSLERLIFHRNSKITICIIKKLVAFFFNFFLFMYLFYCSSMRLQAGNVHMYVHT